MILDDTICNKNGEYIIWTQKIDPRTCHETDLQSEWPPAFSEQSDPDIFEYIIDMSDILVRFGI